MKKKVITALIEMLLAINGICVTETLFWRGYHIASILISFQSYQGIISFILSPLSQDHVLFFIL